MVQYHQKGSLWQFAAIANNCFLRGLGREEQSRWGRPLEMIMINDEIIFCLREKYPLTRGILAPPSAENTYHLDLLSGFSVLHTWYMYTKDVNDYVRFQEFHRPDVAHSAIYLICSQLSAWILPHAATFRLMEGVINHINGETGVTEGTKHILATWYFMAQWASSCPFSVVYMYYVSFLELHWSDGSTWE